MSCNNHSQIGRSVWLCGLLTPLALAVHAGPVAIPNASFEAPLAPRESPYAFPNMAEWQKTPQPFWYNPNDFQGSPWEYVMGTFYNAHVSDPDTYIDNADGQQGTFLFALPGAGLFQDYNSISGANPTPSHAFNATFEVGNAYDLTVGVIGGGGGMKPGVTLLLGLYYRDIMSNVVMVATTSVTHGSEVFPTNTHLVDFQVHMPTVQTGDPWAGQNIGIQILSTVSFELMGGYWDLDNVRLVKTLEPTLLNSAFTTNGFSFTVQSEPGQPFTMLTTTNLMTVASNWISLGTFTNVTGSTNFSHSSTNWNQRYYRAQAGNGG
jgi:hypothetical protein